MSTCLESRGREGAAPCGRGPGLAHACGLGRWQGSVFAREASGRYAGLLCGLVERRRDGRGNGSRLVLAPRIVVLFEVDFG